MGRVEAHLRQAVTQMARRRLSEEPMSRLAAWARRLALFALAASFLSIVIVRSGLLEIVPALVTFGGALVFAMLGILLGLAALAVIWREGVDGLGAALLAIGIGVALVAYPAYLGLKAYRLPAITDVTTDLRDPPRFEAIARLRPRDANPVNYAGTDFAEKQVNAYPDIEPLVVTTGMQQTYEAALTVINKRKWRVVDARAPQASRREGHIEAVARTPIMGFREDVVVRVRADGDGARLDARSSSRYGWHDMGGNAARIRSLLEDVDDTLGSEQAVKKSQPAAKPQPKGAPARR
jgi:uncharacterized protein (DUF1499 family)